MMSSIPTISTRSPPGWEANASWTAATLAERAVLKTDTTQVQHGNTNKGRREGLPPNSIAVFEELVHDMGSQESRDTGNLWIGERRRANKGAWRYTQEQVVETFGVGFSKLKDGPCTITKPELYMI